VISYARKLHQVLELGMPQDLPRHRVFPGILHHTLGLAPLILLDPDHAGREAFLELFLVFPRAGSAEDDVRKKTVRGGGCFVSLRAQIVVKTDSPTGENLAC
jgi:hypothetical protein